MLSAATKDGKCLKCGRPVYERADGTFSHDAPPETSAPEPTARSSRKNARVFDEPPQQAQQPENHPEP
jgi:hypothetical protein